MLDNNCCQVYHLPMLDIQVIDDPAAATVALEPVRSRLLSELAKPASAATLASSPLFLARIGPGLGKSHDVPHADAEPEEQH